VRPSAKVKRINCVQNPWFTLPKSKEFALRATMKVLSHKTCQSYMYKFNFETWGTNWVRPRAKLKRKTSIRKVWVTEIRNFYFFDFRKNEGAITLFSFWLIRGQARLWEVEKIGMSQKLRHNERTKSHQVNFVLRVQQWPLQPPF